MVFVELSALAVARHIGIFQLGALFTAIQGQIWFNMNIAEEGIWGVSLNDILLYAILLYCLMLYCRERHMKCVAQCYSADTYSDTVCANPEQ